MCAHTLSFQMSCCVLHRRYVICISMTHSIPCYFPFFYSNIITFQQAFLDCFILKNNPIAHSRIPHLLCPVFLFSIVYVTICHAVRIAISLIKGRNATRAQILAVLFMEASAGCKGTHIVGVQQIRELMDCNPHSNTPGLKGIHIISVNLVTNCVN